MSRRLRPIAEPFVVAPPTGARIRTRLRVTPRDDAVLRSVGAHLGHLAGRDLAGRVRIGTGDPDWTRRKRALTADCTSRWAGTITRTSEAQWQRAWANLHDEIGSLRRRIRTIEHRLTAPVGRRERGVRGYATQAERWQKQRHLQRLRGRLARLEAEQDAGHVPIVRGGRRLLRTRHHLGEAVLSEEQWKARWQADRWSLSANGEAGKVLGNGTIRVHPDDGWLELALPAPLVHLANRPRGRYRLDAEARFTHRADQWAAQTANGAVRYDVWYDSAKRRWYVDASWSIRHDQVPNLKDLQHEGRVAVDLNADHLAATILDPAGNPIGLPFTIPLDLQGRPAATRAGRLRNAIAALLRLAANASMRVIVVEDLDFTASRITSRETYGRGPRRKRFRRIVHGLPTAKFRDWLVGMATNRGMWVGAVDPAYTSRWGAAYWRQPLSTTTYKATGHHAAALVIGRRSLGHGARRRPRCARPTPEDVVRRATGQARRTARGCEEPRPPDGGQAAQPCVRPAPATATKRATRLPKIVRGSPSTAL
jgi:IS605 OrfB family transposase